MRRESGTASPAAGDRQDAPCGFTVEETHAPRERPRQRRRRRRRTGFTPDATLVIHEPKGHWRCNDDHHRAGWEHPLMPTIDFHNPPGGRYDIWVGTYDATANNPATLFVTEREGNHP